MGHKSKVKKTNKISTGANVQIPNGQLIPVVTTTIATGWNTIVTMSNPILGGTTFTLKFDPLQVWDQHEVKKFKLAPILDFMWLLRAVDVVDDSDINDIKDRFITFSKEHYHKGDQPPKNPYLKHIKQRDKNKRKAKRT